MSEPRSFAAEGQPCDWERADDFWTDDCAGYVTKAPLQPPRDYFNDDEWGACEIYV